MSPQVFALPISFRKQNINHFSKDDILKFFEYLNTVQIVRIVFPVCKIWHEVGRDPILWKKLSVRTLGSAAHDRIQRQVLQVVHNATLLEELYLGHSGEVSLILGCVGRSCPHLKKLGLDQCSVNEEVCLEALVDGCPLVQQLYVLAFGPPLNKLAELKQIRVFNASVGEWFDDTFFSRLSSNNPRLERLNLGESPYCNDRHFEPMFTNLTSALVHLTLDCTYLTSNCYTKIAQCKLLVYLALVNALLLKDSDLEEIQTLPNIAHISIFHANKISSKAVCSFMANLKSTELESVHFEACPKVDNTLEELLASRGDTILHKVQRIDLSSCENVTDRLVELIIKGNSVLKSFKLCFITALHGDAFNTTDTTIAPLLNKLNVFGCTQVSCSYLHTFQSNRPSLSLVFPSDVNGNEVFYCT